MEKLLPKAFIRASSSDKTSKDASLNPQSAQKSTSIPSMTSSLPISAHFPSHHLTFGGGVAIFHLATARVVLCRTRSHRSGQLYYFLPKGRRDAHETSSITAAEREGYEESGYRCRVLRLPTRHNQPKARPPYHPTNSTSNVDDSDGSDSDNVPKDPSQYGGEVGVKGKGPKDRRITQNDLEEEFNREALWTEFLPLSAHQQYILSWYAAETLPPDDEAALNSAQESNIQDEQYQIPPEFPRGITLRSRIAMDMIPPSSTNEQANIGLDLSSYPHHSSPAFQPSHLSQSSPPSHLLSSPHPSPPASNPPTTIYEPLHHLNTGVDSDELQYESSLHSIEDSIHLLGQTSRIQADTVRKAWSLIQLRMEWEDDLSSKNNVE